MSFKFRVVQKLFSTSRHLANVLSLAMGDLVFPEGRRVIKDLLTILYVANVLFVGRAGSWVDGHLIREDHPLGRPSLGSVAEWPLSLVQVPPFPKHQLLPLEHLLLPVHLN
mmetsp:Transcript_44281/g.42978  ORF Transcript_44281/g.42978 Transcript_44281/m.42978 type:complete len:111 (-) Transcript_44281:225-557(-)